MAIDSRGDPTHHFIRFNESQVEMAASRLLDVPSRYPDQRTQRRDTSKLI